MKKKQDFHTSRIAAQNTGCEMLERSAMKVTRSVLKGLEVDNNPQPLDRTESNSNFPNAPKAAQ